MSIGEPISPRPAQNVGPFLPTGLPSFVPSHAVTNLQPAPGGGLTFQNSWGPILNSHLGDAVGHGRPGRETFLAAEDAHIVDAVRLADAYSITGVGQARPSNGDGAIGADAAAIIQAVQAGILSERELMQQLGINTSAEAQRVVDERAARSSVLLNANSLADVRAWGTPISPDDVPGADGAERRRNAALRRQLAISDMFNEPLPMTQSYASSRELRERYQQEFVADYQQEFVADYQQAPLRTEPIYAQSRRSLQADASEGRIEWFLQCVAVLCTNYYEEHGAPPDGIITGFHWQKVVQKCEMTLDRRHTLTLFARPETADQALNQLCMVFRTSDYALSETVRPEALRRRREPDFMGIDWVQEEATTETSPQYHRRLSLRPIEQQQVTPQP